MKGLAVLTIALAICIVAPRDAFARRAAPTPTPTPSPWPSPTASPTPSASLTPRAAPRPTGDFAYMLVGGIWTCKTFAGNPLQHIFRRDEDAVSLIAETTVDLNGRTGKLKEVYRFHRDSHRWDVSLVDGKFVAIAPPWTASKWIFEGVDSENGNERRARMVYMSPTGNVFRRDFEKFADDKWQSYAGEQCTRRPA